MSSPAPLILIPSVCWLLAMFAVRNMSRTRKNWLFALSLILTILLMIALLLLRLFAPGAGLRLSAKSVLLSVTLTLLGGVGIFGRAWGLYEREKLAPEEIAPYCAACFVMLVGAVVSFHIACLFPPA